MAKEHVMVVEDEEDILKLLRYNLDRKGYRTSDFTSGEECLHFARSTKII
jgi:two-component system, OmpR family, alkaline phosphatase synthesis response regulator PhoP